MFFLFLFFVLVILWVVGVFVKHVPHGPIDLLLVFAVLSLAVHFVWGKFPSRGKRGK
ncbi:MAG: hypothetical protein WBE86_16195 [Candidatus Acidiferrales bacterium]